MLIRLFIFALLTALILQSCNRHMDGNDEPNITIPPKSKLLEKKLEIYYYPYKTDSNVYTYSYDATNRVISVKYKNYFNRSPQQVDSFVTNYFYTGKNIFPSLSQQYYFEHLTSAVDSTIRHYFYDNSGRLVLDSAYNYYHSAPSGLITLRKDKFTYDQNKIYGYTTIRDIGNPNNSSENRNYTDTATIDANGNVLLTKRYVYRYLLNNKAELDAEGNYTYDNFASPLSKLNNFQNLSFSHIEFSNGVINGTPFLLKPRKNNCLVGYQKFYYYSQDGQVLGANDYQCSYEHSFDKDNLLIMSKFDIVSFLSPSPLTDSIKTFYYYR